MLTSVDEVARVDAFRNMTIQGVDLSSVRRPLARTGDKPIRVAACTFRDVDFSTCKMLDVWFDRCDFINVTFDEASLASSVVTGGSFTDCSFRSTRLDKAKLGWKALSRFERCSFVESRFRSADLGLSVFSDCLFVSNDFERCDGTWRAVFERCRFEGALDHVIFGVGGAGTMGPRWFRSLRRGLKGLPENRMIDVDWSDAEVRGVNFDDGVDLSSIILPKDGSCRRYDRWPQRLKQVAKAYEGQDKRLQRELRRMFALHWDAGDGDEVLYVERDQKQFIVNPDYWRSEHGEQATAFALRHLESLD